MADRSKCNLSAKRSLSLLIAIFTAFAPACTACGKSGSQGRHGVGSGVSEVSDEDIESLEAFIEAHFEKMRNKVSADELYKDFFPAEYIEKMKEEGKWDSMVQIYDKAYENCELDAENLMKTEDLTYRHLKGAERYIDDNCGCYVKVHKGYEYVYTAVTIRDGEKQRSSAKICAVYVDGEGWKLLRTTASSLIK